MSGVMFEGSRSRLEEWLQETKKIIEDGGIVKMFPVIISWTYVFLFNRKLERVNDQRINNIAKRP
jgi:hypothetical protein